MCVTLSPLDTVAGWFRHVSQTGSSASLPFKPLIIMNLVGSTLWQHPRILALVLISQTRVLVFGHCCCGSSFPLFHHDATLWPMCVLGCVFTKVLHREFRDQLCPPNLAQVLLLFSVSCTDSMMREQFETGLTWDVLVGLCLIARLTCHSVLHGTW